MAESSSLLSLSLSLLQQRDQAPSQQEQVVKKIETNARCTRALSRSPSRTFRANTEKDCARESLRAVLKIQP